MCITNCKVHVALVTCTNKLVSDLELCIKDVQALILVVFIFLCKTLVVQEPWLMLMAVQFSSHSGANFLLTNSYRVGGMGKNDFASEIIFSKKILKKTKKWIRSIFI